MIGHDSINIRQKESEKKTPGIYPSSLPHDEWATRLIKYYIKAMVYGMI